jgi:ATP-dependent Clp protease ATP-binding subunit ClpC
MNVTVPIYIEELRPEGTSTALHRIRPLFFPSPEAQDENLNRAVTKLAKLLKREFDRLGANDDHSELASYSFCPNIEDHSLKLTLELGKRRVACRFLAVVVRALGRKLAFTPSIPDLWFEIGRGETLQNRATEVLTRHFRELEQKGGDSPEALAVQGRAWATTLELDMHPPSMPRRRAQFRFAALGAKETLDGAAELRAVGRCLDWLYPDDLSRAICRESKLEELTAALKSSNRRPVLVVGPRLCGKTALIHECVYRRVSKKKSPYSGKRNVWLLSPQRLISGMIYLGQWEDRLLAILNAAAKRDHVLYFDDLLGLFHAGITRDSNLCAADVIKPYVDRAEFRLLAEMTPEAFGVFQERDRGFADQFQVIRLVETTEDETVRILIACMRELEREMNCRFDFDVLAAVLDIQRRYVRDSAFPGKAAGFLRQLAMKFRNATVSRDNVLEEFHSKSGLAVSFLNDRAKLARQEIVDALDAEVIGQSQATAAAADAVIVAKARLNDTTRPLASFLFLGPTGVGKTQCAKSLASYLFGSADRILRFDMNEYVTAASVTRLAGTFDQPEGLLTSAVRKQPFSVLLLDEIEKAHRDVFDLLLQVMGDARLTDALGRTVDFSNTILILTSNLGVKEASGSLGFRETQSREGSSYVRAARRFFKPEFFNRLDRVIPFKRLRREDVQQIARKLIQDLFAREGLIRRKGVLQVDDEAMQMIVDEGYHPTMGARALKRAVERHLTRALASRLAAASASAPTIVSVNTRAAEINVQVQTLTGAKSEDLLRAVAELNPPRVVIDRVRAAVDRIERGTIDLRPEGAVDTGAVEPSHHRYFAIREQSRRVLDLCRRLEERLAASRSQSKSQNRGRHLQSHQSSLRWVSGLRLWQDLIEAPGLRNYIRELAAGAAPFGERVEDFVAGIVLEAALLETLNQSGNSARSKALVSVRSIGHGSRIQRASLAGLYAKMLADQFGFDVKMIGGDKTAEGGDVQVLVVNGLAAQSIVDAERGIHLFFPGYDHIVPIYVNWSAIGSDKEVPEISARMLEEPFGEETIRVYEDGGSVLDVRTGLMTLRTPTPRELRTFVLSRLRLPEEVVR